MTKFRFTFDQGCSMLLPLLFILPSGASATPTLRPTRLNWCASLLARAQNQPAENAEARAAIAQAQVRLQKRLALHPAPENPRAAKRAERPHYGRVVANLGGLRTDAERVHQLRKSAGRLAQLAADFENPDPEFPPLAQLDVGLKEILSGLTFVPRDAAQREAMVLDNQKLTLSPDCYVRAAGDAAGLLSLTGVFGAATAYFAQVPHANACALFFGASAISTTSLVRALVWYRQQFATEEGRVGLENRYNRDRVSVEPEALEQIDRILARPRLPRDVFAHHGYSIHLPRKTARALVENDPAPPPFRTLFTHLRRGAYTLLIDHVLFAEPDGTPVHMTIRRLKHTSDLPRTVRGLSLLGDI